ncbi:MAG: hypothetical protein ACP5GC_08510 [Thiomonas sp.]|jgi:hypothetical protein
MRPFPWAAVGWFAVALFALGMAIRAFRMSVPPVVQPPSRGMALPQPTPQFKPAQAASDVHSTIPPQIPLIAAKPSTAAGHRLLKCVVNGQVTYTNNPQDCPVGTASSVTVYPTKGYLPTRP